MTYIRQAFDNLDLMSTAAQAWDVQLQPLDRLPTDGPVGAFVQNISEDATYTYAEFTLPLCMMGAVPEGLITFNVMEASKRRYWLRRHDLDAGMAWVFREGAELQSVSPPGFRSHSLSVSEALIQEIAASLEVTMPPLSRRPEVFRVPTDCLSVVLNRSYGFREVADAVSSANVRDVLQVLVASWVGLFQTKIRSRPSVRARDRAVRKCLELIGEDRPDGLWATSLPKEIGVSERTLQYAFRERFGMTPAAFFKSWQLVGARRALKAGNAEKCTVGNVAAQFGFWHMGQFAADYRRQFGERPSDTLRRSG